MKKCLVICTRNRFTSVVVLSPSSRVVAPQRWEAPSMIKWCSVIILLGWIHLWLIFSIVLFCFYSKPPFSSDIYWILTLSDVYSTPYINITYTKLYTNREHMISTMVKMLTVKQIHWYKTLYIYTPAWIDNNCLNSLKPSQRQNILLRCWQVALLPDAYSINANGNCYQSKCSQLLLNCDQSRHLKMTFIINFIWICANRLALNYRLPWQAEPTYVCFTDHIWCFY